MIKFAWLTPLVVVCLLFAVFTVGAQGAYALTSLQFEGTTKTGTVGETVAIPITITTGQDKVVSADIYLLFDPTYLEVQNITAGTFFQNVQNTMAGSGKLYVGAFQNSVSLAKSGTGQVAIVNFLAKQTGQVQLRFDCTSGTTQTSKAVTDDTNKTNIIDCASTASQVLGVTISAAASGTGSSTVTTPLTGATGTGTGIGTTTTTSFAPTTTTTTTTPVTSVTSLPQSGVFENVLIFAIPGLLLTTFGAFLRRSVGLLS